MIEARPAPATVAPSPNASPDLRIAERKTITRRQVGGAWTLKDLVARRLSEEFGEPARNRAKIKSWNASAGVGAVLQIDQPANGSHAFLWLPYPQEGEGVPEIALEYAGESGRHSGTYASPGLEKGKPALKLSIRTSEELEGTIAYLRAMAALRPLPELAAARSREAEGSAPLLVDVDAMPATGRPKPRRQAIPRAVQREVWQRDGGGCVECESRERLCFDHIVPFSRGGGNTVRNIQLLCEPCNLAKGNRL